MDRGAVRVSHVGLLSRSVWVDHSPAPGILQARRAAQRPDGGERSAFAEVPGSAFGLASGGQWTILEDMKTLLSILVFLAAFAGTGFLILVFFSRISGIDMPAAYAWGFRTKRLELVLPVIVLYLIAFIFLAGLLLRPVTLVSVLSTNRGGLAGYPSDTDRYVFYDAERSSYGSVEFFSPPPASPSLREVLGIVSIYRPLGNKQYYNLVGVGLPVTLILIVFSALGTSLTFLLLRFLAQEYSGRENPALKLARGAIAEGFRRTTGLSLWAAAAAVFVLLGGVAVVSAVVTGRVSRNHREVLTERSLRYRAEIEGRVRPGDRLSGRIVSRIETMETEYGEEDERSRDRPSLREQRHYPLIRYTVELEGLLGIPVFVGIRVPGNPDESPALARYEHFAASPDLPAEFIVNEDFTLRLADPGE